MALILSYSAWVPIKRISNLPAKKTATQIKSSVCLEWHQPFTFRGGGICTKRPVGSYRIRPICTRPPVGAFVAAGDVCGANAIRPYYRRRSPPPPPLVKKNAFCIAFKKTALCLPPSIRINVANDMISIDDYTTCASQSKHTWRRINDSHHCGFVKSCLPPPRFNRRLQSVSYQIRMQTARAASQHADTLLCAHPNAHRVATHTHGPRPALGHLASIPIQARRIFVAFNDGGGGCPALRPQTCKHALCGTLAGLHNLQPGGLLFPPSF